MCFQSHWVDGCIVGLGNCSELLTPCWEELKDIIYGEFAEEIVPSAQVSDLPSVTLESATVSFCGLFRREFEHAAETADGKRSLGSSSYFL